MKRKPYPSDLTRTQWKRLKRLLPAAKPGGRPRSVDLRQVLNGIFYILRGGCAWRMMPHDFPPWSTCYDYFYKWRNNGAWAKINDALRTRIRHRAGRKTSPSMGIAEGAKDLLGILLAEWLESRSGKLAAAWCSFEEFG